MSQLHKRFTSDQVKELLERYSNNEIERKYIQEKTVFHAPETVQRESYGLHDSIPKNDPSTNYLCGDRAEYPQGIGHRKEDHSEQTDPLNILQLQLHRRSFKRRIPPEGLPTYHH